MAVTESLEIIGRYPPTIQQRAIIAMMANGPDQQVPFMLKFASLVSPRVDLRRLERTFAKIVARHDALRQSFEQQGDDWFVNVWNRHRTGLAVEDHGDISDSEFRALLDHHASVPIDLLDEVLFQVIVLRCGGRGDVLFTRCHHAIIDGHSLVILTEDWLKLLIGIPILGRGVTHEEYLSEHANLSPGQKNENQKYWDQLLFPALPNPGLGKFGKIGERPRIVYPTDTIRSVTYSLTSADYKNIPSATNDQTQTPFSFVLAAFSRTIIELSELPGIYVQTTVDRASHRLRNYVGCAIRWVPLRCDRSNGTSLAEYSSNIGLQLKQSLAHLPGEAQGYDLEFDMAVHKSGGILRHFNCTMGTADARAKTSPFSSGIIPAPDTPQKLGPLTLTRLRFSTKAYNFFGIRLNVDLYADHTDLVFTYHNHFYSEEDIQALLAGMQDKLQTQLV